MRRAGILLGFAVRAYLGAWVAAYLDAFVVDWHDPINALGQGAAAYPLVLLGHITHAGLGSLVFWCGLLVGRGYAPTRLSWAVALSAFLGIAYSGGLSALAWIDVGPAAFWALSFGFPGFLSLLVAGRANMGALKGAAEQPVAADEVRVG